MKPSRDADALAAKLTAAANAPLPLPHSPLPQASEPQLRETSAAETETYVGDPAAEEGAEQARTRKKRPKIKEKFDTLGITLRPDRGLYDHYVLAAAERTRRDRKPISPQQVMLEILADGVKKLK